VRTLARRFDGGSVEDGGAISVSVLLPFGDGCCQYGSSTLEERGLERRGAR
jgi:hypothetical protein